MNFPPCTLLAAAALLVTEALHLLTPPSEDGGADGANPRWELSHTEAEQLPDLSTYKMKLSTMVHTTDTVPVVPGIKLVMGVLTTAQAELYRNVVRTTWMKQRGVCKAPEGPRENCSVYVNFVQGRNRSITNTTGFQLEDMQNDIVFLPQRENMNQGKTLSYFRFALSAYPWATHYGKMDMDVLPKWDTVLEGLRRIPSGCETYAGRPWSCRLWRSCPEPECGPPSADGLFHSPNSTDTCWSYMQGGLYVISKDLLSKAADPTGYWPIHRFGPEDAVTGLAVVSAATKYQLCVHTWPQEFAQLDVAYFHFLPVPAMCSNAGWAEYYRSSCSPAAGTDALGTQRLRQ